MNGSPEKNHSNPKTQLFVQSLLDTPARNGACASSACHVFGVGTPLLEGTVRDSLRRSRKGTSPLLQVCSFQAALSPDTGSPQIQGWQKSQGAAQPHLWALWGPSPTFRPIPRPCLMRAVVSGSRHLLCIPVQPSHALEGFNFSSLNSKTENR